MFTVLVRKPDATESMYECEEILKEENCLLMRGTVSGVELLGPGGQPMEFDWDRKIRGSLSELSAAYVFIMNSYGKTVGTYLLPSMENYSDPEKEDTRTPLVPLANNDTNGSLWEFGKEDGYYTTGKEISLLDLCHTPVVGRYDKSDRTALVFEEGRITEVVVAISADKWVTFFSLDMTPYKDAQLSSMYCTDIGKQPITRAEVHAEFIINHHTQVLISPPTPPLSKALSNFNIRVILDFEVKIDRQTGIMTSMVESRIHPIPIGSVSSILSKEDQKFFESLTPCCVAYKADLYLTD